MSRSIDIDGTVASIAEWARRSGVSERSIDYRLKLGLFGQALLRPNVRGKMLRPGTGKHRGVLARNRKNERYGMLVDESLVGRRVKERVRIWRCICDCGGYIDAVCRNLARGHTTSCGCLARRGLTYAGKNRLAAGESSFNQLFGSYKKSARDRGYSFELSRDLFRALTKSNCFYCGAPPTQRAQCAKGTNGAYAYIGVDRVDNSAGYVTDNVRPCCKTCNVAKAGVSEADFFIWLEVVTFHLAHRGASGATHWTIPSLLVTAGASTQWKASADNLPPGLGR